MKKLFVIIFLSIAALTVKAQGTLQFSKVLLVTSVQTVPAGKVWKVESVISSNALSPNYPGTDNTLTTSKQILINSSAAIIARAQNVGNTGNGYAAATFGSVTEMPFWLPAAATLAASTNTLSISVIEFNIIP